MADCREQHAIVKFCFLFGKLAAETIVRLQTAYGDAALSKTISFHLLKKLLKIKN